MYITHDKSHRIWWSGILTWSTTTSLRNIVTRSWSSKDSSRISFEHTRLWQSSEKMNVDKRRKILKRWWRSWWRNLEKWQRMIRRCWCSSKLMYVTTLFSYTLTANFQIDVYHLLGHWWRKVQPMHKEGRDLHRDCWTIVWSVCEVAQ